MNSRFRKTRALALVLGVLASSFAATAVAATASEASTTASTSICRRACD